MDERDRATLAGLLLESLETQVDEGAEAAWQAEIERRIADHDTGRVTAIPWDEVKARLSRRIGGDATTGGATVILAMGQGKRAAEAMHEYLMAKVPAAAGK